MNNQSGFEHFCGGPFWDSSLLDKDWPELTPCFFSIVPVWIPCFYVWLFFPYFLYNVHNPLSVNNPLPAYVIANRHENIPLTPPNFGYFTWVCLAKLFFTSCQIALEMIRWVDVLTTSNSTGVEKLNGLILIVTHVIVAFQLWYERRRGHRPLFTSFFFFVLNVFLGSLTLYNWALNEVFEGDEPVFSLLILNILFSLLCLILCFVPDFPYNKDMIGYERLNTHVCPEVIASYPSTIWFCWVVRLILNGFKRPIDSKDLWDLNPRDQGRRVNPAFDKLWQEEMMRVKTKNGDLSKGLSCEDYFHDGHIKTQEQKGTFFLKATEKTPLLNEDKSYSSNGQFNRTDEMNKARPNLFKVLSLFLWKDTVLALVQKIIADTSLMMNPLVLGALIVRLQDSENHPKWQVYGLSCLLIIFGLSRSLLFAQSQVRCMVVGLQMKTVLTAAIFKKSLTMASSAKKKSTAGELVNLMSVDCQRLEEMMAIFSFSMSTPFQIILAIVLLYLTLGPTVLAGVAFMALLVPINSILANRQKIEQEHILHLKDSRIKLVNEILNGMKVLKLYAWEDEFKRKVTVIRELEIKRLFKVAVLYIISSLGLALAPFMVAFCSFLTYILSDRDNFLDARKAFVALALFNQLKTPMFAINTGIVNAVQTVVCIRRIKEFLISEDLDVTNVSHDENAENVIEIDSGKFAWDKTSQVVLSDINLNVKEGQLVAVVGPVGSGKSSLISAILGEMEKLHGHVNVKGTVAYASQQAWIQNATVRDNILFGSPLNKKRYRSCLQACQLERDLDILQAGDQTEIGEKGINLSGGQKQRVNLARAAYSGADIFFFDDPLSAVDSHVGKAIFEELIGPHGILAQKTRILVTHGVQWLPFVDNVIVIGNGTISERGSYQSLISTDGAFAQFLRNFATEGVMKEDGERESENSDAELSGYETDQVLAMLTSSTDSQRKFYRRKSSVSRANELSQPMKFSELSADLTTSIRNIHPENGKLTVLETVETGTVDMQVYLTYWKAAGIFGMAFSFLCYLAFQALNIGSSFWLTKWTKEPLLINETMRTTDEAINISNYYLTIYGVFGITQVITYLVHLYFFWYRMVRAGQRLHAMLLKTVFHAPMAFFDQTPIGRILNRFSRDIDVLDNTMPIIIRDFLNVGALFVSTILVITIQTPIFAAILVPLLLMFYGLQTMYVRTSRQLKRIESVSRSPIYSHFSETITGAAVIRAYGASDRFLKESQEKVDINQLYYFASQAAIRWLQVNIDILVNLIIFLSAVLQIINNDGGSHAGLTVSYALQIATSVTYLVRQVSEFETNIVSVERLQEYSHLEQEADTIIHDNRPDPSWPYKGDVKFDKYEVRYREGLDLVLKGVDCDIKSGEKIGIVGRTGAGKSSLTLCLFRILEAAGGSITIDGINIASIGLYDLRSRLTILPQDPVLFSGTLRMNVDPFDEYSDQQLWKALEQAHLKSFACSQPEGLAYECGEEGLNLSVGQRQLVCLARALLRHTRVLILDEATAAIDFETDSLIQKTIREAFAKCTILAIAHRINTIMDYDRVMVMDAGVIREFDSPQQLIEKQGVFYSMCQDAGLV